MRILLLLLGYFSLAFFIEIWPFSNEYEALPFSEYEKVKVNAYFYFPDNSEIYLGEYKGASACQYAAANYARSKNISNANWGYICCTIEKGSSCYQKIK